MSQPQSVKQIYREFMQANFPELKLRLGLFYEWPHRLRFDLQLETPDRGDFYFEEVQRRASMLFEAVFDPADRTFFVFKDIRYRREKIHSTNYAFRQIDGLRKEEIVYWRERTPYDTYFRPSYNIALVLLVAGRINHCNILAAIGNQDFPPRKPMIDKMGFVTNKEIYFVNETRQLIFNMYDDRGLDIIAANRETLRPVYERYNDWLLDYNREQIDMQFCNCDPS